MTRSKGVPCTIPSRTLVDLAGVTDDRQLRRALQQSSYLRLLDRCSLDLVLSRSHGRRGTAVLRQALAELSGDPDIQPSELERRFLELVRAAGLPEPVVQGFVAGHRGDFHWPEHMLVVETDGRAAHGHALAFEADRQRDFEVELAGWHVVRFTWRQLVDQPERAAQLLRYSIASIGSEKSISASSVAIRRP